MEGYNDAVVDFYFLNSLMDKTEIQKQGLGGGGGGGGVQRVAKVLYFLEGFVFP